MKKNKDIEVSFWRWVFLSHYGWRRKYLFGIGHNPILMMFTNLCIYLEWFNNDGKFKPGDKVKYNFFARVSLPGIEEIKGRKHRTVYTFVGYPEWSKSKSNCDYVDDKGEEGSCAAFWLSKTN